jgi:hypothetical protein
LGTETTESLIRFQEFYNLSTDGRLNKETLDLIDVALKIIQQYTEFITNKIKQNNNGIKQILDDIFHLSQMKRKKYHKEPLINGSLFQT